MKKLLVCLLLAACLLSGCAGKIAQEVVINANIGSTTEADIVSRLGMPKNEDVRTQFIEDNKIERILYYGTWRSQGKYYRLIICTEQGKCIETIASPDNHSNYAQISFRFVDGKLTNVFPGY